MAFVFHLGNCELNCTLSHFRSNEADNFILGQHFIGRSKETLINKPIELRG